MLCLAGCWLLPSPGRADTLIDDFSYRTQADARKSWMARDNSEEVLFNPYNPKSLIFPLPFNKSADRYYWDHPASLNLSSYNSFELDMSAAQPEASRAVSIYFKSGSGWYEWTAPLLHSGRQILNIMKSDFKELNQPAGWDKISMVRFSAWKGQSISSSVILHYFQARETPVLLVRATDSAPNAGEISASRRAADRISRWLQNIGIPHSIVTDDQLSASLLRTAKLTVLCYNPSLPLNEKKLLQNYLRQGGKLFVFYSSDASLAQLMGMRIGAYTPQKYSDQFSSIRFNNPSLWNVPPTIYQHSWNIRPAYPQSDNARIIAEWYDGKGKSTDLPAITMSNHGLWISHILLDDDIQAKEQLLLGLIGRIVPSIWPRCAWLTLHRSGRVGPYRNLNDAFTAINALSRKNGTNQRMVEALLKKSQSLFSKMLDAYEQKQFSDVIVYNRELEQTLTEAYARSLAPESPEIRAIWDHDGTGLYPGNWDRTARIIARGGLNTILVNVAWGASAHYSSQFLPLSDTFRTYGDQLQQCVTAADKYHLKTYPWIICWNMNGLPPDTIDQLRKDERLLYTADNKETQWLNPAHPANRKLLINVCRELVSHYDVEGIHLDYIRYPDKNTGFGTFSRKQFMADHPKLPVKWPQDVRPGGRFADIFNQWRTQQINTLVQQIKSAIQKEKPQCKLTAAVYGGYPGCIDSIAQDWGLWLQRGWIDSVFPMNYTPDAASFKLLLSKQIALPRAKGRIIPGIGVTASESQLSAADTIEQILITREAHTQGFALFKLDSTLENNILPLLQLGLTRPE